MASVMFYKAIEISCIIYYMYVHGNFKFVNEGLNYFCLRVNATVAVYFKTNKTAQNNVLSILRTTTPHKTKRENTNNKYDFRTKD